MNHRTFLELESLVETVRQSPPDEGVLELIVCRPAVGMRQVLTEGELSKTEGLVGDSWLTRGKAGSGDSLEHLDTQLTIMNSRAADLVAGSRERWPLAGDQLYVDMDLSKENLPPGTLLAIGTAIVMVTAQPHTGCKFFAERFGKDAVRFVNSTVGKKLNLRGINARIETPGSIRAGDVVRKLEQPV